jgi:hypothetical protein
VDLALQIAGALLILVAYVLGQFRRWKPDGWSYLIFNLAGSTALTVDAFAGRQWGFFLLEGVWAVVTTWSLVTKLGRRHV